MSQMLGEPHDAEAERVILGSVFLMNDALDDLAPVLGPEDFYGASRRTVYDVMLSLRAKKEPIEVGTVVEVLRSRNLLESIGGVGSIEAMDAEIPATANYMRYARRMKEMSIRRGLIRACMETMRDAQDDSLTTGDVLAESENRIAQVRDMSAPDVKLVRIGARVREAFDSLEALYERQESVTGVPSGFAKLDAMTCGFQKGEMTVIAARPGIGKTAIVTRALTHMTVDKQVPAIMFSLEMSDLAVIKRMLASEGGVNGQRMRDGKFEDTDWPKLTRAAERLYRSRLVIDGSSRITTDEIRARARRVKREQGGLGLIAVDYLGLLRNRRRETSREQEVAAMSGDLKAIARDLDVPVIVLAQLNRDSEKRADKRPILADLRESGSVEQDADMVWLLYRDEMVSRDSKERGKAEVIIAKQRNGPTGTVELRYIPELTRFEDGPEKWG